MSITAKQMSQMSICSRELDSYVASLLQTIDSHLERAPKTWGRNVVTIELPDCIILGNLTKSEAQRLVYSKVLRDIDKRGFEVRILLEGCQSLLYIAWTTAFSDEESRAMTEIIKAKRIRPEAVESFMVNGDLPSAVAGAENPVNRPSHLRVAETDRYMSARGGVKKIATANTVAAAAAASSLAGELSAAESAIINSLSS